MNCHYKDILDRLGPPLWWDEVAAPRYCNFSPDKLANIYADEAALLIVACQNCRRRFKVAISTSQIERLIHNGPLLSELIQRNVLHYGDPPNVACCPAGPTMNSEPIVVVEFWENSGYGNWKRVPALEVGLQEGSREVDKNNGEEGATHAPQDSVS